MVNKKGKGAKTKGSKPPVKKPQQENTKDLTQQPPQERVALVRPLWETLDQEERVKLLSIGLDSVRARANQLAEAARQQAVADAPEGEPLDPALLELEPSMEDVLEEGIKRLKEKGTWKLWHWPADNAALYDAESFRQHITEKHIRDELRRLLPRDEARATEKPAEAAFRQRIRGALTMNLNESEKPIQILTYCRLDLLSKVQQSTSANSLRPSAVGANGEDGATRPYRRRGDPGSHLRDANIELLSVLLEALAKENDQLYHSLLTPITTYVMEILPEGHRETTKLELSFEDLENLLPDDVTRIVEWLTEKVDALSTKLKPEPKEDEEEEEENMGDVDLWSLNEESNSLTVNAKWLQHLQERLLGEDGHPRRAKPGEDPGHNGLVLEALEEHLAWETRARQCKDLLSEMLKSRLEAAELTRQGYDLRPQPKRDLPGVGGESGQASASPLLLDDGMTSSLGIGAVWDSKPLPDEVILFMLRREALLTRAKLHFLVFEHLTQDKELRILKQALRQGEPEFERLKRELDEVKHQPRGMEGAYRSAAEMERHRHQLEVQTAFREQGARLQATYDKKQKAEYDMAKRETEIKQLQGWKSTVENLVDKFQELITCRNERALAASASGGDSGAIKDSEAEGDLEAASGSLTPQQYVQLTKMRNHFAKDVRKQLYGDADDRTFFDNLKAALKILAAEREAAERERKKAAKAKKNEKAKSEKERLAAERTAREAAERAARQEAERERTIRDEQERRKRMEAVEAMRKAEEAAIELRRKELLSDENGYWRQRMIMEERLSGMAAAAGSNDRNNISATSLLDLSEEPDRNRSSSPEDVHRDDGEGFTTENRRRRHKDTRDQDEEVAAPAPAPAQAVTGAGSGVGGGRTHLRSGSRDYMGPRDGIPQRERGEHHNHHPQRDWESRRHQGSGGAPTHRSGSRDGGERQAAQGSTGGQHAQRPPSAPPAIPAPALPAAVTPVLPAVPPVLVSGSAGITEPETASPGKSVVIVATNAAAEDPANEAAEQPAAPASAGPSPSAAAVQAPQPLHQLLPQQAVGPNVPTALQQHEQQQHTVHAPAPPPALPVQQPTPGPSAGMAIAPSAQPAPLGTLPTGQVVHPIGHIPPGGLAGPLAGIVPPMMAHMAPPAPAGPPGPGPHRPYMHANGVIPVPMQAPGGPMPPMGPVLPKQLAGQQMPPPPVLVSIATPPGARPPLPGPGMLAGPLPPPGMAGPSLPPQPGIQVATAPPQQQQQPAGAMARPPVQVPGHVQVISGPPGAPAGLVQVSSAAPGQPQHGQPQGMPPGAGPRGGAGPQGQPPVMIAPMQFSGPIPGSGMPIQHGQPPNGPIGHVPPHVYVFPSGAPGMIPPPGGPTQLQPHPHPHMLQMVPPGLQMPLGPPPQLHMPQAPQQPLQQTAGQGVPAVVSAGSQPPPPPKRHFTGQPPAPIAGQYGCRRDRRDGPRGGPGTGGPGPRKGPGPSPSGPHGVTPSPADMMSGPVVVQPLPHSGGPPSMPMLGPGGPLMVMMGPAGHLQVPVHAPHMSHGSGMESADGGAGVSPAGQLTDGIVEDAGRPSVAESAVLQPGVGMPSGPVGHPVPGPGPGSGPVPQHPVLPPPPPGMAPPAGRVMLTWGVPGPMPMMPVMPMASMAMPMHMVQATGAPLHGPNDGTMQKNGSAAESVRAPRSAQSLSASAAAEADRDGSRDGENSAAVATATALSVQASDDGQAEAAHQGGGPQATPAACQTSDEIMEERTASDMPRGSEHGSGHVDAAAQGRSFVDGSVGTSTIQMQGATSDETTAWTSAASSASSASQQQQRLTGTATGGSPTAFQGRTGSFGQAISAPTSTPSWSMVAARRDGSATASSSSHNLDPFPSLVPSTAPASSSGNGDALPAAAVGPSVPGSSWKAKLQQNANGPAVAGGGSASGIKSPTSVPNGSLGGSSPPSVRGLGPCGTTNGSVAHAGLSTPAIANMNGFTSSSTATPPVRQPGNRPTGPALLTGPPSQLVGSLSHSPPTASSGGGIVYHPGASRQPRELLLVRGLQNLGGQHNCFLNVIIQSLWHLRSFREAVLQLDVDEVAARGAASADVTVLRALVNIFRTMAAPLKAQADAGLSDAAPSWVVSPLALREALSVLETGQAVVRLDLSEMHDASEVLLVLLTCMHRAEAGSGATQGQDPHLPRRVRFRDIAATSSSIPNGNCHPTTTQAVGPAGYAAAVAGKAGKVAALSGSESAVPCTAAHTLFGLEVMTCAAEEKGGNGCSNGHGSTGGTACKDRQQQQCNRVRRNSTGDNPTGTEVAAMQAAPAGTTSGVHLSHAQAGSRPCGDDGTAAEVYTKYVHLVPAQALRKAFAALDGSESGAYFEDVLCAAEATGAGAGTGQLVLPVANGRRHAAAPLSSVANGYGHAQCWVPGATAAAHPLATLVRFPSVFTLVLVWESLQSPLDALRGTLQALGPRVDLALLFRCSGPASGGMHPPSAPCDLRSVICYFGHHYLVFALSEELGLWLMIDDANIQLVGHWADVVKAMCAKRLQPSVLFYEATEKGRQTQLQPEAAWPFHVAALLGHRRSEVTCLAVMQGDNRRAGRMKAKVALAVHEDEHGTEVLDVLYNLDLEGLEGKKTKRWYCCVATIWRTLTDRYKAYQPTLHLEKY
ncbi:hypothetical protein VOLCADRAFT_104654 [Volvox carteri f. nagariensis]|uniref:USP domain-containing protein n=1 Tax=Volvox carteri f. nagariensis TaxID=3068 RepID=D8TVL1_VOLCA|nr:uncharacterized protein VOLCADRAFT_104654 [Volvox carteri f. nagariensis]EFJ48600.1 hypothetical protein VOLCADRAFT_104654 [Volvox carteri f. nagariensis]|eukprot:XP_002950399.1 hypothetical protein VOLCADRAFT_104654 [Volvox carteri f. nagariensis]